MKFEDLPLNVQLIAVTCLADILKMNMPEKELAEQYASSIKSAFVQMYTQD